MNAIVVFEYFFLIYKLKSPKKIFKDYNEVDLKYMAIVKNSSLIEKCVKLKLKKNQVISNREIYHLTPEAIKKTITDCYCKYVNKDNNEELYKELSDLLGLYSYVKNKKNIKPYVIIDDYKK